MKKETPPKTFKPKTPIQARAMEKRSRILEEAYLVFAEQGYDAANTRDIAAAAGATHAAIRYHFGSKDALWRATVTQMFEKLRIEIYGEQHEEQDTTPIDTETFIRKYIRYCAKHPNHARIMISESVRGGERLSWMAETFIGPSHKTVLEGTKSEQVEDEKSDLSSVFLLYSIVSMCQLPFVLSKEIKALYDINMHSEESIEKQVETVLTLLNK